MRAGVVGARGQRLLALEPVKESAQIGNTDVEVGVGIEELVGVGREREFLGHLLGGGGNQLQEATRIRRGKRKGQVARFLPHDGVDEKLGTAEGLAIVLGSVGVGARIGGLPEKSRAVAQCGLAAGLGQLVCAMKCQKARVRDQQEGQCACFSVALENARFVAFDLGAGLGRKPHAVEIERPRDRGIV